MNQTIKDPGLCEHANENPHVCRCPSDCYCQVNTCKDRDPEVIMTDLWSGIRSLIVESFGRISGYVKINSATEFSQNKLFPLRAILRFVSSDQSVLGTLDFYLIDQDINVSADICTDEGEILVDRPSIKVKAENHNLPTFKKIIEDVEAFFLANADIFRKQLIKEDHSLSLADLDYRVERCEATNASGVRCAWKAGHPDDSPRDVTHFFEPRETNKYQHVPLEKKSALQEIFDTLAGSWNHHGVINWFARPRVQLGGRTPSQAIDDGDIKLVLALAKAGQDMIVT